MNYTSFLHLNWEACILTKEDVQYGEQAEGHSDGQFSVDSKAEDQSHRSTEQQSQKHHQPRELKQRLHLLPGERLHLI